MWRTRCICRAPCATRARISPPPTEVWSSKTSSGKSYHQRATAVGGRGAGGGVGARHDAAAASVTSSIVQDHYGDALFALKRYAEAITAWERALAGDLSDVESDEIQKKISRARAIAR